MGLPLRAQAQEENGRWASEAERARRVLEKAPQNEAAWAALTKAWLEGGDLRRAQKTLEEWGLRVPQPGPQRDALSGRLAAARGDFKAAVAAWKRCVAAAPKEASAWRELAAALEKERAYPDALEALGKAVALAPTANDLIRSARLRACVQDWPQAEAEVRRANQLDASNVAVKTLLPVFERAGEWLPALRVLDARVAKEPKNVTLRLDRAEALEAVHFHEAALEDALVAFELKPASLRAQIWRRLLLDQKEGEAKDGQDENGANLENDNLGFSEEKLVRKKTDFGKVMPISAADAKASFKARLREIDESTDREKRALLLVKIHQPLLALDEAAKLDGSPARALALLDLERLPEAGRAARKAVKAHPGEAAAWFALGRVELLNGNNSEAAEALKRCLALEKDAEARVPAEKLCATALRRLGK